MITNASVRPLTRGLLAEWASQVRAPCTAFDGHPCVCFEREGACPHTGNLQGGAAEVLVAGAQDLLRQVDELQATLDNEFGRGEPPSPDWKWIGWCWENATLAPEGVRVMSSSDRGRARWQWRAYDAEGNHLAGNELLEDDCTARSMMRDADNARAGWRDSP